MVSKSKHLVGNHEADPLIRDGLELIWSVDKPRSDLTGKLQCLDTVAHADAKVHRGFKHSGVIAA